MVLDYGPLLTVAAILVALLSFWAQGWARFTGRDTNDQVDPKIRASAVLGTLWIYTALSVAFLSLGLLLVGKYWEGGSMDLAAEVGFGFFITSFLMAFSSVLESTVTRLRRVLQGDAASDTPTGIDPRSLGTLLLQLGVMIALSLLFSTLGVVYPHWWWLGLIPIWAFGLCLYLRLTRE